MYLKGPRSDWIDALYTCNAHSLAAQFRPFSGAAAVVRAARRKGWVCCNSLLRPLSGNTLPTVFAVFAARFPSKNTVHDLARHVFEEAALRSDGCAVHVQHTRCRLPTLALEQGRDRLKGGAAHMLGLLQLVALALVRQESAEGYLRCWQHSSQARTPSKISQAMYLIRSRSDWMDALSTCNARSFHLPIMALQQRLGPGFGLDRAVALALPCLGPGSGPSGPGPGLGLAQDCSGPGFGLGQDWARPWPGPGPGPGRGLGLGVGLAWPWPGAGRWLGLVIIWTRP